MLPFVKEEPHLAFMRTILALLIAVSLTVSPVTSAMAAMHDGTAQSKTVETAANAAMSDCMKAMGQGQDTGAADPAKSDCDCCQTKSKCPEMASCMTKCCKVIGYVRPATRIATVAFLIYQLPAPDKPPDWTSQPPSPPPRS